MRVIARLNIGGPARHVAILGSRMGDLNGVILTGEPDAREGSLLDEVRAAGARVEFVPGLRRRISPGDDLRAMVWLYRYFRRVRPDIVASHTAKAGAVARTAAWLARVPVRVHTFHGHVLEGYFGRVATTIFRTVERILARLTTQLIAVSPATAVDLAAMGIGPGRVTVVRNGLELDYLRESRPGKLRAELGLSSGQPLVGIVGRLAPVKAHDLFLEAARLVLLRRPQARFVIVGDGELWEPLHQRVEALGLRPAVFFTGWRHDLVEVYSDLDLVVCCSLNEGTPVSVIEAGAAGRPVVGTRVGGMSDIISDGLNGFLVRSGDAAALAGSIDRILGDPRLAMRLGAEGRRLAFANHSATRMVDEMRRLYARLLEAAGRTAA